MKFFKNGCSGGGGGGKNKFFKKGGGGGGGGGDRKFLLEMGENQGGDVGFTMGGWEIFNVS